MATAGTGVDGLAFDVLGDDGPAVVALHGLTSSRARESRLGLDVTGALDGCRVLRYDARGHGRSAGRPSPDDYTWPRLADDLLRLVEHVFDGEAVHGIGGSMGAATLLHAAAAAPARFSSLTLVVPPTAWATRAARAADYEAAARLVETDGVDAWVAAGAAVEPPPATVGRPETPPDVVASLLPSVLRGAARSDLPPLDVLETLDVPTSVLAWTDDPAHPLATVDQLVATLPRCAVLDVASHPEHVAHWPDLVAGRLGLSTTSTAAPPH